MNARLTCTKCVRCIDADWEIRGPFHLYTNLITILPAQMCIWNWRMFWRKRREKSLSSYRFSTSQITLITLSLSRSVFLLFLSPSPLPSLWVYGMFVFRMPFLLLLFNAQFFSPLWLFFHLSTALLFAFRAKRSYWCGWALGSSWQLAFYTCVIYLIALQRSMWWFFCYCASNTSESAHRKTKALLTTVYATVMMTVTKVI